MTGEPQLDPEKKGPETPAPYPLVPRIIFWVLFLYISGLAIMIIEDVINHSYL
jgi:hypothetical protein